MAFFSDFGSFAWQCFLHYLWFFFGVLFQVVAMSDWVAPGWITKWRKGITIGILIIGFPISTYWTYHEAKVETKSLQNKFDELNRDFAKYKEQNTPRLSATFPRVYVLVGVSPPRQDQVVSVPVTVNNNSPVIAYDVVLDILFSDGTGRVGSLNEYLIDAYLPPISRERLLPFEPWSISPQAISSSNREAYVSGANKFRAKLQLTWKDASGNQYQYVQLGILEYSEPRETYGDAFWFKPLEAYNSIDSPEKLNENWGPFKS